MTKLHESGTVLTFNPCKVLDQFVEFRLSRNIVLNLSVTMNYIET